MSKQKFNGTTLYTKTCVDNILTIAEKYGNPEDRYWYEEAYEFGYTLAYHYNTTLPKVLGIIAALSPQKSWIENKRLAENFLKRNRSGHTQAMLDKAEAILSLDVDEDTDENILDILNGQKISAFYLNMRYYDKSTAVTVDRHAIEIALYKVVGNHTMTAKQYAFFQRCYLVAAERIGYLPHELQAITWVAWRIIKKAHKK